MTLRREDRVDYMALLLLFVCGVGTLLLYAGATWIALRLWLLAGVHAPLWLGVLSGIVLVMVPWCLWMRWELKYDTIDDIRQCGGGE